MLRTVLSAATFAAASFAVTAGPASAEQVPVLLSQNGAHSVWIATDEQYEVENYATYWDFVPLNGMCGFAGTKLVLSNMDETFKIETKPNGAKAGSFTGIGKILDERFTLTQYDAAGSEVRTFAGGGVELAQFRGTGEEGQQSDLSTNLRVLFRGASPDGTRLSFSIKLRMRMDAKTGEPMKFDAAVDSCHVG